MTNNINRTHNLMPLNFGLAQHDGYKTPSEDFLTHKIYPNGYELFGVFDGHNSDYYPNAVSKILPSMLSKYFEAILTKEQVVEALIKAFENMDIYFKDAPQKGGTTATVSVITDTHIITASLGDSIALYFNMNGTLLGNTTDHNTNNIEECKRITKAGGSITYSFDGDLRVNGTLALTRSFGDKAYKDYGVISVPDIYIWAKEPGYLSLMSDSFTENRVYSFLFESYISNKYNINDLSKYIFSFIQSDLTQAAKKAVITQVTKFKKLFRNKYYGDNTSLIYVKL